MSREIDNDLVGQSVKYKINNCQMSYDIGTVRAVYMKQDRPCCLVQCSNDNRLEEVILAFCYINS